MDDLDRRLIELFAAEPRIGVLEASRRLGVARGTVQARLDKLAATGVVTGWGPDLSPEALGFPVTAFLTLEIRQGVRATTPSPRHLAGIPEVLEAYTITGAGDMWARVVARSNADLQRVIDRVLAEPGIVRSHDGDRPGHPDPAPGAAAGEVAPVRSCGRKIMQLEVACATTLPASSLSSAWASAVRRPRCSTVPSQVSRPESAVTGRRNFTVRSSEVYISPTASVECTEQPAAVSSSVEITPPWTPPERVVVERLRRHLDDDAALLGVEAGHAEGVHDRRRGGRSPATIVCSCSRPSAASSRSRSPWPGRAHVDHAGVGGEVAVVGSLALLGLGHGSSLATPC